MNTRTGATHVATPSHLREIVTRRKRGFRGYYPSAKVGNGYRLVGYESLLERDFLHLMEDDDAIISYQEQDAPVRWSDGIDWHSYWPDVAFTTDMGRRVCVEVKPLDVFETRGLIDIYQVVRNFVVSSDRFDEFQIWTDREIRSGTRLRNACLRNSERIRHEPDEDRIALEQALRMAGGSARIDELRIASGLGSRGYRAVLRMLAEGSCSLKDPAVLIGDASVILWRARS